MCKRFCLTIRIELVWVFDKAAVVFVVRYAIIVIVMIASISFAIFIMVDLVGIGDVGAIVQVVLMAVVIDVLVAVTLVSNVVRVRVNLVRVVLQWTVVTMVTNSVPVTVPLVSVVHIRAVVLLIQNTWTIHRNGISTFIKGFLNVIFSPERFESLTIAINVNGTSVSLAVVVSVCLFWITVIRAVIASIADLIVVLVVLSRVKDERAVILFQNEKIQSVI